MRFIIPVILILISVAGFFQFSKPFFNDVNVSRAEVASLNEALSNSKAIESERDKLVMKFNSMSPEDLKKLEVLMPNNVDNIRLILEIEKIASPYGMALKDVKYNTEEKDTKEKTNGAKILKQASEVNRGYGDWDLEFSTEGSYSNFTNFIKDLEKNLRIVDVLSVEFSSTEGEALGGKGIVLNTQSKDSYKYKFKIKTYFLKN